MSPEGLLINTGLVVKALHLTNTHQLHQIMVARNIFRQQNQVEHAAIIFLKMRALGQIDLTAQNRLDALLLAFLIKLHRAIHGAVIRNGQRLHAQLLSIGHQLGDFRGTIQQTIFRMHM